MREVKYKFHYQDYRIIENEEFYEKMAKQGWILEVRGGYLSRFRLGEPQNLKYRVEFHKKGKLPQEQIDFYQDCGFEFVTKAGYIHVFSCIEDTDLYVESIGRMNSIEPIRKSYLRLFIFSVFMIALMIGVLVFYYHNILINIIEGTRWPFITVMNGIVIPVNSFINFYYYNKIYTTIKKNKEIKKSKRINGIAVPLLIAAFYLVGWIAGVIIEEERYKTVNQVPEGYLQLVDFGEDTDNEDYIVSMKENKTFFSHYVYVSEQVEECYLSQTVIEIKYDSMIDKVLESYLNQFSDYCTYEEIEIDAYDKAYINKYGYLILVKDRIIYTYGSSDNIDVLDYLETIE